MALKTVTFLGTLMGYASAVGKARKNGAPQEEIDRLQKQHDDYQKLCLESDEMVTGHTVGTLFGGTNRVR